LRRSSRDKEREANDGFDGTWVAHPGLVSVAKDVFDRIMPRANQIERKARRRLREGRGPPRFRPAGPITERACAPTST
jgi:malate synthase